MDKYDKKLDIETGKRVGQIKQMRID